MKSRYQETLCTKTVHTEVLSTNRLEAGGWRGGCRPGRHVSQLTRETVLRISDRAVLLRNTTLQKGWCVNATGFASHIHAGFEINATSNDMWQDLQSCADFRSRRADLDGPPPLSVLLVLRDWGLGGCGGLAVNAQGREMIK